MVIETLSEQEALLQLLKKKGREEKPKEKDSKNKEESEIREEKNRIEHIRREQEENPLEQGVRQESQIVPEEERQRETREEPLGGYATAEETQGQYEWRLPEEFKTEKKEEKRSRQELL